LEDMYRGIYVVCRVYQVLPHRRDDAFAPVAVRLPFAISVCPISHLFARPSVSDDDIIDASRVAPMLVPVSTAFDTSHERRRHLSATLNALVACDGVGTFATAAKSVGISFAFSATKASIAQSLPRSDRLSRYSSQLRSMAVTIKSLWRSKFKKPAVICARVAMGDGSLLRVSFDPLHLTPKDVLFSSPHEPFSDEMWSPVVRGDHAEMIWTFYMKVPPELEERAFLVLSLCNIRASKRLDELYAFPKMKGRIEQAAISAVKISHLDGSAEVVSLRMFKTNRALSDLLRDERHVCYAPLTLQGSY
jgi:hypothetical protein